MYTFNNLIFRGVTESDIPWLHKMSNTPSVADGYEATGSYILPASEAAIRKEFIDEDERVARFIIDLKSAMPSKTPTKIGYIQLYKNVVSHVVEPMLFVDPEHQRQGHGKNIFRFGMWAAFNILNASKYEAFVFGFNEASQNMCRNEGMLKEGVIRHHMFRRGKYWDAIYFGKLRGEWEATIAEPPHTINDHWSLHITGV